MPGTVTCMLCNIEIDAADLHAHLDGAHGLVSTMSTPMGRRDSSVAVVRRPRVQVQQETQAAAIHRVQEGSSYECACGGEMRVIDSRKVYGYVIRRRECEDCAGRFSTYEVRFE